MSLSVGSVALPPVASHLALSRIARWTIAVAVVHAALAASAFALLGAVFGFPGILREPADVALAAFQANPAAIRFGYYLFTLSALLFVPLAVLARDAFAGRERTLLTLAAFLGAFAGLTQMLGFARWTILVPAIADLRTSEQAAGGAETALALYDFANRYLGMTVGEHFGWLFQAPWTALLAVAALRVGLPRWLGVSGLVIAAAMLISAYEPFGIGGEALLGLLNAGSTTAAPFWLIALFVVLSRSHLIAGRS